MIELCLINLGKYNEGELVYTRLKKDIDVSRLHYHKIDLSKHDLNNGKMAKTNVGYINAE